jgi:hypothetical protein
LPEIAVWDTLTWHAAAVSAVQVVADELLAAAAQLEAAYADPYDAPVYGIQLAKVEAKAAREAVCAAAAAAKAARWARAVFVAGTHINIHEKQLYSE